MSRVKKHRFRNYYKAMQMELREHKSSAIVYFSLRLIVILIMIRQIFNGNYESMFLCLLTLLLMVVPSFVQVTFKVELPTTLEVIILLFIFAAEILGEINEFYILLPFWDTILHTLNGFLAAAIGFSLVDLLNRNSKLVFQMSPLFMAIVSFCFSMTIGVVWEFFEFGMDQIFNFDMQKDTIVHTISSVMLDPNGGNVPTLIKEIEDVSVNGSSLGLGGYLDIGLVDTMEDLFVNFIGATVFSIFGFVYVKTKGKHGVAGRFIMRRKKKDRDFLKIVEQGEKQRVLKISEQGEEQ